MVNLKQASNELFRRSPDECFASLDALRQHCRDQHRESKDCWQLPHTVVPLSTDSDLRITAGESGQFTLNDWSFSQLCMLGGVAKDTVNRLSPETAGRVLRETLPRGEKPLQLLTTGNQVRSIHGVAYSRLWNTELLTMLQDYAVDFQPPQTAFNDATGLYCGEQDLFCFLIDPAGWIDIGGEAFAPGFFVWNSEVGRRSLGISTFWFQKICQNHIVWDAVDVVEYTRKHTGNIRDSLIDIRQIIEAQVKKRDDRTDGFVRVIRKAMESSVGSDAEEATKFLLKHGITRDLIRKSVQKLGEERRPFTLWTLVDALTQLSGEVRFAGDRLEIDQKVAQLLALAV